MSKNYYLFKNGRLKRKDNSLAFYFGENFEEHQYIPVNDVDTFFFFGELDLNTKLINFLAENKICGHFFNYYGFYTGSFYPREKLNSGFLLVKQVEHYSNKNKRISLARLLIEGAVYNIKANLKYYKNKARDLEEELEKIESFEKKIPDCSNIPALMAIEGNIREIYYSTFKKIINKDIEFKKRVKRPPDNMINTLISFLNMMVYTLCLSEIYKTQLNPTVSYLHEPGVKRFSLSLDIAEIFKPLIADRIIFSVLNKDEISDDDFEKDMNYVYLKEKGRKTIIKNFEEKISSTVKHRKLKRHVSYRHLIRLELYKLIKHLIGENSYEPFKIYW